MRVKLVVQSVFKQGINESISMSADPMSHDESTFSLGPAFAELSIRVTNPVMIGKIKQGQKFYLDLTEATAK